MTRQLRGSALIDVLVALPLIALLGIVAVQLLLGVHRAAIRTDGALGATRELRHGASVLAAELRGIRPRDLIAWSDTSVEFDATVGLGVACAIGADRKSIAVVASDPDANADVRADGADALAAMWNQPPQTGDHILMWLSGTAPADSLRGAEGIVRAVSVATGCEQSPLTPTHAGVDRIDLTDPIIGTLAVGTPVRVTRRTRYSLYRASDGDWFLGRRTLGPAGWDVVQPVAGPMLTARGLGMVVTVRDTSGAPIVSPAAGIAARVGIALRAPRKAGRASPATVVADSARIEIALRSTPGDGP